MTNAYKEDPHWCCVTGFLAGVADHEVAGLSGENNCGCLGCGEWLSVLPLLVGRSRCNLFLSSSAAMGWGALVHSQGVDNTVQFVLLEVVDVVVHRGRSLLVGNWGGPSVVHVGEGVHYTASTG